MILQDIQTGITHPIEWWVQAYREAEQRNKAPVLIEMKCNPQGEWVRASAC